MQRAQFLLLCLAFSLLTLFNAAIAVADDNAHFEAHMRMPKGDGTSHRVALTLDACSGSIDQRILDVLIAEHIPATLFVTARWLRANPKTFKVFLQHPDLFQIEDHGAEHVPALLGTQKAYGIAPAGTEEAIATEVLGGSQALTKAGAKLPLWYRGATALYSLKSSRYIESLGFRIAGFSLNGDQGASLGAAAAQERISAAKDGDIIIAHINQPTREAGAGVALGIKALKAKGVVFVLLRDTNPVPD